MSADRSAMLVRVGTHQHRPARYVKKVQTCCYQVYYERLVGRNRIAVLVRTYKNQHLSPGERLPGGQRRFKAVRRRRWAT